MTEDYTVVERDEEGEQPDPDETPVRDRRLFTQPYDLVVSSLIDQIRDKIIFLRPISDRPSFQRHYVWKNELASKLIESILLNVPIPPCFLSQNEAFELDVIDGQQRMFSVYRFVTNQFALQNLGVLAELNGKRFLELPEKLQRQIKTHTLRCIIITNESHPEIKFEVFERLNTNTVPLNPQELRNCIYRGTLNELLKQCVAYSPWLEILNKKSPDNRMRDEELVLRFFSFHIRGIESYKTPQKYWLNETAKAGKNYDDQRIFDLSSAWYNAINVARIWLPSNECFRRINVKRGGPINRALFDLTLLTAKNFTVETATAVGQRFRNTYLELLADGEFLDLISRAVDHKKRTLRRFEIWNRATNNGQF